VTELLENRDPYRFDDLYAGLPDGVRTKMEELSPLAGERRISVPVGLISGPRDIVLPRLRVAGGRRHRAPGSRESAKRSTTRSLA